MIEVRTRERVTHQPSVKGPVGEQPSFAHRSGLQVGKQLLGALRQPSRLDRRQQALTAQWWAPLRDTPRRTIDPLLDRSRPSEHVGEVVPRLDDIVVLDAVWNAPLPRDVFVRLSLGPGDCCVERRTCLLYATNGYEYIRKKVA
jgi:hypothetical protein